MGNRGSTTDNNEQEIGLDHVITRLYKISSRFKKESYKNQDKYKQQKRKAGIYQQKGDEEGRQFYIRTAQEYLDNFEKYLILSYKLEFMAERIQRRNYSDSTLQYLAVNISPIFFKKVEQMNLHLLAKNLDALGAKLDKKTLKAGGRWRNSSQKGWNDCVDIQAIKERETFQLSEIDYNALNMYMEDLESRCISISVI